MAHPGVDQPAHKDDLKGPRHNEKTVIQPVIHRTCTRVHELVESVLNLNPEVDMISSLCQTKLLLV